MMREMSCSNPRCKSKILRKSHDGMWRFSTKVLKANDDGTGVIAVCKSCGEECLLPVQILVPSPFAEHSSIEGVIQKSGFGVIETKKP